MENNAMQTTTKVNSFLIESEAQISIQELAAAKAAKGDTEALAQLCEMIAKGVLFRMSRMLRSHVDAEDAAQEALIRVCKSIKQLKNPKTFRKWLGTIIVNEARRKGMQNTKLSDNVIHLSDLTEAAIDEDESFLPEQFAMNSESRKAIIEAIDRLPQRQKEAVLLHYYDRLNVTETAEVMGISQPAASIHLKEACSRLKRDIESSADKLIRAMQGFIAIPLGDMLSRALYSESAAFLPESQTWMAETIEKCGTIVLAGVVAAGGAAGAAGAAGASSTKTAGSSTLITIAKGVATTVAAAAATLAITVGVITLHSAQNNEPLTSNATGTIVFSSNNAQSHINPTSASASTDSRYGELKVHNWNIETTDGSRALYTGESSIVDERAFNMMRENRQFGEYKLIFFVEDAYGATYELKHNFFLYDQEINSEQEEE